MAVLKSTKKSYPDKFEQGLLWYNSINSETIAICSRHDGGILGENWKFVEYYTEAQKGYFSKMVTWAFFKCYMDSATCADICQNTSLADHIEHFAFCTHDKDKAESHTHGLVKFYRNEQVLKLVDYFHCDNCANALNTSYQRFKYLTHDSDNCRKEGKYQYLESEIITDDLSFFKNLTPVKLDNTPMTIIEAIISGKSERYLCEVFGDRYIYNKAKYRDSARQICMEEDIKLPHQYEIIQLNNEVVTLYNKDTGELVEVCQNLEQAKLKLYEG